MKLHVSMELTVVIGLPWPGQTSCPSSSICVFVKEGRQPSRLTCMTEAVFRFTNCVQPSAVGCDESSAKRVNTLNLKGRLKQIPDPLLVENVGQITVEISLTERIGFANDLGACMLQAQRSPFRTTSALPHAERVIEVACTPSKGVRKGD